MARRSLLQVANCTIVILIASAVTVATNDALQPPLFSPPQHPPTSPQPSQSSPPHNFLEPILLKLGFRELAKAAQSLPPNIPPWNGPSTVFAPSDAAIKACAAACSPTRLLQEHIVPGLLSLPTLRSLPFGTKIETLSPGRCATLTSGASKLFIGGIEISRPDLFTDGSSVTVHGLDGFVSHLSPFSCTVELSSSVSLHPPVPPSPALFSVMRMMLRDAMLRLRISGYSVLALALRVKHPQLVGLHNVTVFALDDVAIFNGGHVYLREVKFHIVPNRLLTGGDLDRLVHGTLLPTLGGGEPLVVTGSGVGLPGSRTTTLRINHVRIRHPDLVRNQRIVVHGLFMPFPHVDPTVERFRLESAPWPWAPTPSPADGYMVPS